MAINDDLDLGAGITLFGGLILLLFNIGEVLRGSSFYYILISFAAAIAVMLSGVLFYYSPAKHLRYGLIVIFSSVFMFAIESLGNLIGSIDRLTPASPNLFFATFSFGVLLSVIGGILLVTYEKK